MKPDAATFIEALQQLEQSGDVDPIAALFAEKAKISNPLVAQSDAGGAVVFWTAYRSAFDEISSTFANIFEQDDRIALEWRSIGSMKGKPVTYEGVSVLEVGDDGIRAFRCYFDTGALGHALTSGAA